MHLISLVLHSGWAEKVRTKTVLQVSLGMPVVVAVVSEILNSQT